MLANNSLRRRLLSKFRNYGFQLGGGDGAANNSTGVLNNEQHGEVLTLGHHDKQPIEISEIIRRVINSKKLKDPDRPFYICNLARLSDLYEKWTFHLPRVKPYYALKANSDEMMLRTLVKLGLGFDCASKEEITKVVKLGVSPSQIIFAHPTKMPSHILEAKKLGVSLSTFDNIGELHKIKELYPDLRLLLRFGCDDISADCKLGEKFGASDKDIPKLLVSAKELGLHVIGLCFHVGSGSHDEAIFHKAIREASTIFNVAKNLAIEFSILNIGGGFPGGNSGDRFVAFANVVNCALDEFFPVPSGVELMAEPGAFFCTSPFTLVTKIHSVRVIDDASGGKKFAYYMNDGVYGSFISALVGIPTPRPNRLKMLPAETDDNNNLQSSSLFGPTCCGFDVISPNMLLPKLNIGDYLYFNDMGAYSLALAGNFNGFPIPQVFYHY